MKQNITLSLEKEIIKKGKILAAGKNTSISKMLGDLLEETTQKEQEYEASKRKAIQYLKMGFHFGGNVRWTREELHER